MTPEEKLYKKFILKRLEQDLKISDLDTEVVGLAKIIGLRKLIKCSEKIGGDGLYIPTLKGLFTKPRTRLAKNLIPKYDDQTIMYLLDETKFFVEKMRKIYENEKVDKIMIDDIDHITKKDIPEILADNLKMSDLSLEFQEFIKIVGLKKSIECCKRIGGYELYISKKRKLLIEPRKRIVAKLLKKYNKKEIAKLLDLTERCIGLGRGKNH